MIALRDYVVDKLSRELSNRAEVSAQYQPVTYSHMLVTVEETDNRELPEYADSANNETAQISFEINIFANDTNHKIGDARNIAGIVDELMRDMGFTRVYMRPVPNLADATIYRITSMYSGVTDAEHTIYKS